MAREVDYVWPLLVHPIEQILRCCCWPMVHLNELPMRRLLYRLAHLADFNIHAKIRV